MTVLKDYFKNIFRLDFCMFDVILQHTFSCKMTVIAITIFNVLTYVFLNYYRCRWRKKEFEYKHVYSVHVKNEPFIWEAAWIMMAASVLFKSAKLTNLKIFQDSDLAHNNLIDITL